MSMNTGCIVGKEGVMMCDTLSIVLGTNSDIAGHVCKAEGEVKQAMSIS